LPYAGGNMPG